MLRLVQFEPILVKTTSAVAPTESSCRSCSAGDPIMSPQKQFDLK